MSTLGDIFGFEKFHAGDLWKRLKKDPKRLLLGVDPASTKLWNAALSRDDKPLVDELGGPDPGVYGRAEAAGVPTTAGKGMHDIAHVIAAAYGAKGLSGIGAGSAGGGGGQGVQQYANMLPKQQGPQDTRVAPSAIDEHLERERMKQAMRQQIAQQMQHRYS